LLGNPSQLCVYTWYDSHPSRCWRLVDTLLTLFADGLTLVIHTRKVSCMLQEITKASAEMRLNVFTSSLSITGRYNSKKERREL
jgi:hypothetical protein